MTSSSGLLVPLSILIDPAVWPEERRRHALLIGDPAAAGGWGNVVAVPSFSPFGKRHAVGCACCARNPVSMLLAQVFQDRVLGKCAPFREVAVLAGAGETADMRRQLEEDVLVRARYRLEP